MSLKKKQKFVILGQEYLVVYLNLKFKGYLVNRVVDPIGLLHRGTEKLIEYKIYLKSMPYFDRLYYVLIIAQEKKFLDN